MLPKVTSRIRQVKTMQSTTLRGFTGGLNTLDDDMNLSYKYSKTLTNCYINPDGTVQVRYGTRLFSALDPAHGKVINIEYYNSVIIAVQSDGTISQIAADGINSIIDSTWSSADFVSFAQFNGNLILCNGVDKPLTIDRTLTVSLLQDLGTGTNINVPVCKYVVSNGRYLVMSGDLVNPERVHISAKDAPGTWHGDPPPNDATFVDVGSVLSNASTIRGLLSFRDKLLVLYAEGIVIGSLGIYDDTGNHVPTFDDAIEQYGCVSHRVAVARGDDGLFMDLEGVPSIKRTTLSGQLKPERASELIDTLITARTTALSFGSLEDRTFAVYDNKNGQYMLFMPNTDDPLTTTETAGFLYSYRPVLKQDNWSTISGWNWTCGCRSLQGYIFFGDMTGNIWLHGSRDVPIYADFVDVNETPITFDWEMAWTDLSRRDNVKNSKYISFDTRGTAEFTCSMYVDNIIMSSALTGAFSGGEQGAFGNGDQPYGGGNITSYKKLFAWPAKFEFAKMRFTGSTTEPLSFVSITLKYQMGSVRI